MLQATHAPAAITPQHELNNVSKTAQIHPFNQLGRLIKIRKTLVPGSRLSLPEIRDELSGPLFATCHD